MNLAKNLIQIFTEKKLLLSAAESCSGGLFSYQLVKEMGASKIFLGSVVAYSNQLKETLLDVPRTVLEKDGAVSREVVVAMWKGILKKTKSDYAIAITGIAGPTGGSLEIPVGTVWCCVGRGEIPLVWKLELEGSREIVMEQAVKEIFLKLIEVVT